MKTVFALLVGIDDYPPPVPRLSGCANDARAMRDSLAGLEAAGNGAVSYKVRMLLNAEATRDAVIAAFRDHFGQAGPGDTALFCYSGHGSQEAAPEEFWAVEPDHLNETLVLHDSRQPDSWDLADKELAALISTVTDKGGRLIALLDCCHSGSGTRAPGLTVRRAPIDTRVRPAGSFVGLSAGPGATRTGPSRGVDSGWTMGGRHVLLAACRDDQEAKEHNGGGSVRGAFSYFLGEAWREAGGAISCRELFARTSALMQGQIRNQLPQLEASDPADLDLAFPSGVPHARQQGFLATFEDGGWVIDAGRMDGVPEPVEGDPTEVALFPLATNDAHLADRAQALVVATVASVGAATSRLAVSVGEERLGAGPLRATILRRPLPRLLVMPEGDEPGKMEAEAALAASSFVRIAAAGEAADFRLVARNGEYVITRSANDRPLVREILGQDAASARSAVQRLEHIERWIATARLQNGTSAIPATALRIEVSRDGRILAGDEIRLAYDEGGNAPKIVVRLANDWDRPLYVGLLDLPETFGIFAMLNSVGSERLEPGQATFLNTGKPLPVTIPNELWRRGMVELKDIIKVIVSTSTFDVRRLCQPDAEQPYTRGLTSQGRPRGTLEQLMERVQTRHTGDDQVAPIDDWRTLDLVLTTVRPQPAMPLSAGSTSTLAGGVRVEPHAAIAAATARVGSLQHATRALGRVVPLPHLLYDDPAVIQPFPFIGTRDTEQAANVIELDGVDRPELVSPVAPLRLVVPRTLASTEQVLPVAFDGEFYLPLGYSEAAGTETRLVLERLPSMVPDPEVRRSLGGSVRILFHKVMLRRFGADYPYPVLAAAEVDPDEGVRYEPDPILVRRRVAGATRIALFVHGIIGDTRDMSASLRRMGIADDYDLMLTFDYENLNDHVADTARALAERLEAVGLRAGHGKSLDIIAHSMGGLVSRYFVERVGGYQIASRLVMLGTPNGGSPWPSVADWATTALTVGLNGLTTIAWPAGALAALIQATRVAQVTLGDMTAGSQLLKEIGMSPRPAIPYLLVAGNTSLIPGPARDERLGKLRRLLTRLWSDRTKYDLADRLFSGADNDIAVSLGSIGSLPRAWTPHASPATTACDHLSYFRDPGSLKVLRGILAGTGTL